MKQFRIVLIGSVIWSLIFLLSGCNASKPSVQEPSITPTIAPIATPTNPPTEYIKLLPEEAQAMMSEENVIILDVRTQEEYDEGHVPNAILLPDYELQEKAESIVSDKKQTILVYCRSGNRSERAAKALIAMGYEKVYDFGGIKDWTGEIVGNWLYPSCYNYFGGTLPPDITMPIDFTTTKIINDEMPELTFHLTGNNVKSYGMTIDNTKYYIMLDNNNINQITITDPSGALVQSIDDLTTENPATKEEMYGLSFEDWNFDGFMEIGLWTYPGGTMRNDPHYYWLWDSDLGQFVENKALMELSDFSTITVLPEENRLESFTSFGAYGYTMQYYEFRENNFILVKTYTLNVETPSEENDKYQGHITVTELIDGEMKVTDDYYEESEN